MTCLIILALVGASLWLGDWRLTLGIILGGVLSLLNIYWLRLSLKNLLNQAATGAKPRFNAALYILRYLFIAIIVAFAAMLGLVSVAATLIGLLSFAFAILLEAIIQLIFIIFIREES
ncbi:MAG: ATP synthase subunit I [Pyrinomonadaceae bacterium]